MSLFSPTSPVALDAFDAPWLHEPLTYLAFAAICLVIVLRFLRRALAPIGVLLHAAAAAAVTALATVLALALLFLAAYTTVR